MSRKKWMALTDKEKDKMHARLVDHWDKLTDISPDLDNALDIFEAITDHTKDIFECNEDCTTCTVEDLKSCVHNFRVGVVFMLGKIKTYEQGLNIFLTGIRMYVNTLLRILKLQIEDEEVEDEEDPAEEDKLVDGTYI